MSGHYAPVDDVHIMSCGRMCVSGSRDRTAILWHLDTFLEDDWNHGEPPKSEQLLGHDVSLPPTSRLPASRTRRKNMSGKEEKSSHE